MGCRRKASASTLVRVAHGPGGTLAVGRTLPGRGAWLCRGSPGCFERAVSRDAFGRALRSPVPPEVVAALRRELEAADDVRG